MFELNQKKQSRVRTRSAQAGFSIVELLVVIVLLAVLATIGTMSLDGWHKSRLASASAELLADLQTVRMNALTTSSPPPAQSRGFGLRFLSNTSYTVFEFIGDGDVLYEGLTEENNGRQKIVPNGITIESGTSGTPLINLNGGIDESVLIYDKRGIGRKYNWSSVSARTFVVRHAKLDQARCVSVSSVRIREGMWDDATSECREL